MDSFQTWRAEHYGEGSNGAGSVKHTHCTMKMLADVADIASCLWIRTRLLLSGMGRERKNDSSPCVLDFLQPGTD